MSEEKLTIKHLSVEESVEFRDTWRGAYWKLESNGILKVYVCIDPHKVFIHTFKAEQVKS